MDLSHPFMGRFYGRPIFAGQSMAEEISGNQLTFAAADGTTTSLGFARAYLCAAVELRIGQTPRGRGVRGCHKGLTGWADGA